MSAARKAAALRLVPTPVTHRRAENTAGGEG